MDGSAETDVEAILERRTQIESRISELLAYLEGPHGLGRHGNLIDKDGFPIGDVEKIITVRSARNELATLENDHKEIMNQIETLVFRHFARRSIDPSEKESVAPSPVLGSAPPRTNLPVANADSEEKVKEQVESEEAKAERLKEEAFARIASVSEHSPAFMGGLRIGDLVVSFGYVNQSNHEDLQAMRDVVVANEDCPVEVAVVRGDKVHYLSVVPTKWRGPGLLGCHFLPFNWD